MLSSIVTFVGVGLIAGWLCGIILRGKSYGMANNLLLGLSGSFMGQLLAKIIGIRGAGLPAQIFISLIGIFILLMIIRVYRSKNQR